ncbi:MAG: sulfide/dihydroorotate dehydrogenase-like FAD/NAD-binding protein [Candidatus Latescibacteria bacterium]|nr:sulfide/dihydroorotate dehydrogenase-like FAD/NAD-binding protein [Candidatus Latescibacterota bacterium]
MVKISKTQELAQNIKLFEFDSPLIARKAQPGQFVVLRINEPGERIPLTIADAKKEEGVLVIVFQEVGKSTRLLGTLKAGDTIMDLIGPLGKASEIEKFGTVVCVAGGVGTPEIFPVARALKQAGNRIISIVGARNKELLIMQEEMQSVSDELYITTDDGSYGRKGLVIDELKRLINENVKIDKVFAVGPVIMMKAVSETTRPFNIATVVSLNPIMLDATGMCGVCRVEIDGETKFACVDGPEFDGHKVNFDSLMARLKTYIREEKESMQLFSKHTHSCTCGGK